MPYGSGRNFTRKSGGEETSDAYQKAIEQRVQRTLHVTVDRLVEWSKRSDFDTKYLEQDFGRQGGWDPIRVPLGEDRYLRLIGQIDRIDEYTRGWSNLWYGYRLQIGRRPRNGTRCILWPKTAAYDLSIGVRIRLR